MKTNIGSEAAYQDLKTEIALIHIIFYKPAVFLQTDVGSKGFYETGSRPKGAKAQLWVGSGFRASLRLIQHVIEAATAENRVSTQRPRCSLPMLIFAH